MRCSCGRGACGGGRCWSTNPREPKLCRHSLPAHRPNSLPNIKSAPHLVGSYSLRESDVIVWDKLALQQRLRFRCFGVQVHPTLLQSYVDTQSRSAGSFRPLLRLLMKWSDQYKFDLVDVKVGRHHYEAIGATPMNRRTVRLRSVDQRAQGPERHYVAFCADSRQPRARVPAVLGRDVD